VGTVTCGGVLVPIPAKLSLSFAFTGAVQGILAVMPNNFCCPAGIVIERLFATK